MDQRTEKRIIRIQNMNWFNMALCQGDFQIPVIRREQYIPDKLLDFSKSLTNKDYDAGIHFFLDDYRFERFWACPDRYFPILKRFSCALSPDFSLFCNMSRANQLWNVYRSRLLGQVMQRMGIRVIPSISWSDSNSYQFCFDGVDECGVVAVSSVGVMRNKASRSRFQDGLNAMITRVNPTGILFYGHQFEYDFKSIPVFFYENTSMQWKKIK